MATSTCASDDEYLVRNAMKAGYQFVSLLTPPVYATLVLARHGRSAFTINRLLRATWLGGVGGKFCNCLIKMSPTYSRGDQVE